MNEPPAARMPAVTGLIKGRAARQGQLLDPALLERGRGGSRTDRNPGPRFRSGRLDPGGLSPARASTSPGIATTSGPDPRRLQPRPEPSARATRAAHARSSAPSAAPPASPAARVLTPPNPHPTPGARTRTRRPVALARPPPALPQPDAPGARPPGSGRSPPAPAPSPHLLGPGAAAPHSSSSPPSRMVATAAAATQTLGSGGRAPRPEVTFPAASARAAPPPLSTPPPASTPSSPL